MSSFLQRLFTKSDTQKQADFRNNLQALIHSYGEVMERKETISDIELLPAPKQMMKKLLLEAMKMYPPGEQREFLKGGYVMLSSFQPMSDLDKVTIKTWDGLTATSGEAELDDISLRIALDAWPIVSRLLTKALDELDALSLELVHAGFGQTAAVLALRSKLDEIAARGQRH